jgi:hypothetical protein
MPNLLFHYYLGLDLGQAHDFSAICLLEEPIWIDQSWAKRLPLSSEEPGWRSPAEMQPEQAHQASYLAYRHGRPPHPVLAVRHLERLPLGTPYPAIVDRVRELLHSPALKGKAVAGLVDKTGVGAPVIDSLIQSGLRPMAITIHGGAAVSRDPQRPGYRVPKRDLVAATQILLQTGRLKMPRNLPLVEVLRDELLNFKVKLSPETSHDSYEHGRAGEHDDLVLSCCMAAWFREWWNKSVEKQFARKQREEKAVYS